METTSQRISWRHFFLMMITAFALILPGVILNSHSALARTTRPSSNGRTVLRGHLIPALKDSQPLHQSSGDRQLQLSIALNLRNQDELQTLLQNQANPTSQFYHQYLTPQAFADLFGPTQDTVNQVTTYLTGQGLHVDAVSSNHTLISVTGSIATIEKAFSVDIDDFTFSDHGKNRDVYAPVSEPSVPSEIGNVILNVGGLSNIARYQPVSPLIPATGPRGGYTPSELRTAYNMSSLISQTNGDGTGQTVAIFELDGYKSSDITTYLSQYNLGSAKYSNVLVDGATNTAGSGAIEVELDMEVVSAIAPGATQKIYIGPNSGNGVNDTYNKIVTDNIAKVTSTSWGLCEASSGTSELAALHNIFLQGAAQGQSFFAASGDSGAYDCGRSSLGVDSPADDPYVTGVGGTNLQTGSGGTYSSESVWNNGSSAGGGGYSTYFSKPSWQTGTGVDSNTSRHVPDVSADADPNTGYSIYCSVTAAGCSTGWTVVGGTSAAAPLWAAVAADTNGYLAAQNKPPLGSANSRLYALFNTTQPFTAYHDVTSGNNRFYNATAGYDLASGIGTPNAWNFAQDLARSGGTGTPTPTPTATPARTPTTTPTSTPVVTPTATPTGTPVVTPTATPTSTPVVTPTTTPTSTTGAACSVSYTVSSQWPGGFGASVTINNTGTTPLNSWTLMWTFANGQTITQLWNGSYTQSGGNVSVTNLSYNGTIAPGGNTNFGFNGAWNSTNTNPTVFTLNGVNCTAS